MKNGTKGAPVILEPATGYEPLLQYLKDTGARRILAVHGNSAKSTAVWQHITAFSRTLAMELLSFTDFSPNPREESARKGAALFRDRRCDMLLAIGGGSAMDVAKCIKLYAEAKNAPFLAVPTTAGSGSEATRYAVIYRDGEKQSITDESLIPSAVLLDPSPLATLPLYQRRSTMLDALCHAMESWWSVNSNGDSVRCSKEALKLLLENKDGYLRNEPAANANMLRAAHLAGRAINVTQTTAGHAMCYKLTSFYGIAHGHAAALCTAVLWPYMAGHLKDCADPRGKDYLAGIFRDVAACLGGGTLDETLRVLPDLLQEWDFGLKGAIGESDIDRLAASVHQPRLKNNPVKLSPAAIRGLYRKIREIP